MAILALALGGAWLLSLWSRTARNVVLPDLDTFDRGVAFSRRVAGALGRIPVLGSVWRASQRLTQGAVDRAIEEQRRTIDDFYGRPEANDKA
jgi:hypothetical protein